MKTLAILISLALLSFSQIGCSQANTQEAQSSNSSGSPMELSVPALGTQNVWQTDYENSHISFSGSQEGSPFNGQFNNFKTAIKMDPDAPENSVISVVIDMASFDANDKDRNDTLPSKAWFYTKKFPEASFTSNNVTKKDDGSFEAEGDLTIRSVTKPIRLPFTLAIADNKARAQGRVTLNRLDYNLGSDGYDTEEWIDFAVTVNIDIVATAKGN